MQVQLSFLNVCPSDQEMQGRGRVLLACRFFAAGELILDEEPCLVSETASAEDNLKAYVAAPKGVQQKVCIVLLY